MCADKKEVDTPSSSSVFFICVYLGSSAVQFFELQAPRFRIVAVENPIQPPRVETDAAEKREAPWLAGLRAARANLLPGLILQALMLLTWMSERRNRP